MSSPRASVAMATCDGSAHLSDQLESIFEQTRPPDELVICDDASSDDTLAQAEVLAARAPFPVRIERNDRRLGSSKNFERAVSLCSGDIIFLADQDDVWLPEKIACHLTRFDARPELGACFSNGRVVDAELRPLGYELWEALWFDAAERRRVGAGQAVSVFLRHVVAAGTTFAFRARHRELVLPFPELRSCHDAWIAFMVACVAEVEVIERDLILYRLHRANQIGLEKPGLRKQLALARAQLREDPESGVESSFAYADRFFSEARDRLAGTPDGRSAVPSTLDAIEAKIAHSRRRGGMPPGLLARLPAIAAEAINGNYWRYSYGLKSIAQDTWLR